MVFKVDRKTLKPRSVIGQIILITLIITLLSSGTSFVFGFKEYPFSLTPDTQFFFRQNSHQEALATLLVALEQGLWRLICWMQQVAPY